MLLTKNKAHVFQTRGRGAGLKKEGEGLINFLLQKGWRSVLERGGGLVGVGGALIRDLRSATE